MKYNSFILLLIGLTSCVTTQIRYNQTYIAKKSRKGYQVTLDNQLVDYSNIFLDKDNIASVELNRKTKFIHITQHQPHNLMTLDSFQVGTITIEDIGVVVIDGLLYEKEKIKIDQNVIKAIQVLKWTPETASIMCRNPEPVLLITTK